MAETSGIGADRDTGGMQLNMIPRDGGNIFSGIAQLAYSGPDLQSNNIGDELIARGLERDAPGTGVHQEVLRRVGRRRRPDQAEQAVVLRVRAQERHAAVCGRHLLEQAHAAGRACCTSPT